MGQYHYTVNWDRREYLDPHRFGDGLKLMEFGNSSGGTMLGLAVLLASSNQGGARGGGDLHPWHGGPGYEGRENSFIVSEAYEERLMKHVVGRWAGDRISVLGDYCEESELYSETSPWSESSEKWTDISGAVVQTICLDYYTRKECFAPPVNGEYVSFGRYLPEEKLVMADGRIKELGATCSSR